MRPLDPIVVQLRARLDQRWPTMAMAERVRTHSLLAQIELTVTQIEEQERRYPDVGHTQLRELRRHGYVRQAHPDLSFLSHLQPHDPSGWPYGAPGMPCVECRIAENGLG
jgi:hypothetical protein